tara:strand:+ start:194 stop:1240 length:1047 start_codon:yes stop_codon:yes gene_type:complete
VSTQRNYDPFGKPRLASGGLMPVGNAKLNDLADAKTRRGFTDHEHLDDIELIHMNGRVYDYNLGRFMSVDPVIQSPTNSQSINPYSYIMNNPLAGTDPTGYSAVCASSGTCPIDTVVTTESGGKVAVKMTEAAFKKVKSLIQKNGSFSINITAKNKGAISDIGNLKEGTQGSNSGNSIGQMRASSQDQPLDTRIQSRPTEGKIGKYSQDPNAGDKEFQKILLRSRGDIAAEIELAKANKDRARLGLEVGVAIYQDGDGYTASRPSTDVPTGKAIGSNHLNLIDASPVPIKNAKAIVIYNPYKVRSVKARYENYMRLSKRLNAPVYVTSMYSRSEVFIHSDVKNDRSNK